jgi:hypothetical protein
VWAFSDESERANVIVFGVVLVPPGAVEPARTALRALLMAGERGLHTSDESARRRRVLLDTVARIEGLSAVVLRYHRPAGTGHVTARHLLLQAATGLVVGSGVSTWTLDNTDPAQRARDRASIAHALGGVDRRLRPDYDHRRSRTEPLLWAADAVCWAVTAGGDWQRRIATIVTVRDIRP